MLGRMIATLGHYTLKRRLGDGTYGDVYEALDTRTDQRCAIKRPRKLRERTGVDIQTYRELNLLRGLEHPNVIRLLDVFLDTEPPAEGGGGACRPLNLVLEFAQGGDLQSHLKRAKAFSAMQRRSIARQLVDGVAFLHRNWVLHRDLKPANVLLANDGRVKIADFGMARAFAAPLHRLDNDGTVVTLWYRAPELLLGAKSYGTGVDTWALGCIIAELLTRSPIFHGQEERGGGGGVLQEDQLHRIFHTLGMPSIYELWPKQLPHWPTVQKWRHGGSRRDYPVDGDELPAALSVGGCIDGVEPALLGLLRGLLRLNPATRLAASDTLDHPYFTDELEVEQPPQLAPFVEAEAEPEELVADVLVPSTP